MNTKNNLARQIHQTGSKTTETSHNKTHLLLKTGHLKESIARTADDVVGFNNLMRSAKGCFTYYEANPPLIGLTNPVPVQCPLSLAVIPPYKLDYKKAIELFHRGNWGTGFTGIGLSKPLYPGVMEPYWTITGSNGITVVIGANSGKLMYSR